GPVAIRPVTRIDRVDPSRTHGHPHLARAGDRISNPAGSQLLRAAELADQHGFHSWVPSAGEPASPHPSLACAQADIMTYIRKAAPDGRTACPAMDKG